MRSSRPRGLMTPRNSKKRRHETAAGRCWPAFFFLSGCRDLYHPYCTKSLGNFSIGPCLKIQSRFDDPDHIFNRNMIAIKNFSQGSIKDLIRSWGLRPHHSGTAKTFQRLLDTATVCCDNGSIPPMGRVQYYLSYGLSSVFSYGVLIGEALKPHSSPKGWAHKCGRGACPPCHAEMLRIILPEVI